MYLVKIKTKYNLIELIVDDVNSPEMKEILNQDYIEEVYIETTQHYKQELIEEKKRLLNHVVGMSYNTNKVLELMKKKGD